MDSDKDHEKIAMEIAKTSDSIRKKYRALKTGKMEEKIALERHFKPITEPLKQIIENTFESSKDPINIETFFSEKDEEPKPKRKRPNASYDIPIQASTPVKSALSRSKTVPSTLNEMSEITGSRELSYDHAPSTMGQKYLKAVLSGKKAVNIDVVYGVYFSDEGTMFGDKHITLSKNDDIAVCDHTRYFTHIYVGNVGSVHDSRVFRLSSLQEYINNPMKFPNNAHLIGDAAYALHTHLLVPYPDNGHLTQYQKNYNLCHSSTRMVIERAFALLKGRWRSLLHVLAVNCVDFVPYHILACCVLHNICLLQKDEMENMQSNRSRRSRII
ncbi:Putative nuclease HARBI1 [Cyphomyrmex costatus]|uniref:Putative nuclease HARBI1 n=1 Tax=Cyphomyrmex costatus TaxID=456900 RepID=A0A151IQW0_9HYME|nr:Putative nuclease HARBI1 [Cyphomyrmex costatus]